MSADPVRQLRALRIVLDQLAPPVTLEEFIDRADSGLKFEESDRIVEVSAEEPTRSRLAFAMTMAASIIMVVAIAAIASRDSSVREPVADQSGTDSTASPATSLDSSSVAQRSSTEVGTTSPRIATPASTASDWVPVPLTLPPPLGLDEVPALVPEPAPGSVLMAVQLSTVSPETTGFVQIFTTDDGAGWLHVETGPEPAPSSGRLRESVGPWHVTESASASADASIWLEADGVTVALWSNVLDTDDLAALAGQLRPGPAPDAGWDLGDIPGGLHAVAEGPSRRWEARLIVSQTDGQGLDLALQVMVDSPELLSTYFADPSNTEIVDLDGRRALHIEADGVATLVWEYQPRVIARLGVRGASLDDLLAIASGIRRVDNTEWDRIDSLASDDGCPSFWC